MFIFGIVLAVLGAILLIVISCAAISRTERSGRHSVATTILIFVGSAMLVFGLNITLYGWSEDRQQEAQQTKPTVSLVRQQADTRKLYKRMQQYSKAGAQTGTQVNTLRDFNSFKASENQCNNSFFPVKFSTEDMITNLNKLRAYYQCKVKEPDMNMNVPKIADAQAEQWLKEKRSELKQMLDSWNNPGKPKPAAVIIEDRQVKK